MNLDEMSLQELKQLQRDLERAITGYEQRQLSKAREKLEAHARELGFSLAEITDFENGSTNRGRKPLPAKYRNPKNPKETWSGRGRKPRWLTVALTSVGAKLEDFLVK